MLEVVEHQQRRARAQYFDQLVERIGIAPLRDAKFAPEPLTEFGRCRQVVERHQGRAIGKHRRAIAEHALCQTRLANAAGAGNGEQPAVVLREQRRSATQFDGATDEAVVGRFGCERRGARGRCGGAESFMQRLEFGARFEPEFVREAGDELTIGLPRARNLPGTR